MNSRRWLNWQQIGIVRWIKMLTTERLKDMAEGNWPESGFYDTIKEMARVLLAKDVTANHLAELEASEIKLIEERDHAEDALSDMFEAATGERPEWSNWFGFRDAVDVVANRHDESNPTATPSTRTRQKSL